MKRTLQEQKEIDMLWNKIEQGSKYDILYPILAGILFFVAAILGLHG